MAFCVVLCKDHTQHKEHTHKRAPARAVFPCACVCSISVSLSPFVSVSVCLSLHLTAWNRQNRPSSLSRARPRPLFQFTTRAQGQAQEHEDDHARARLRSLIRARTSLSVSELLKVRDRVDSFPRSVSLCQPRYYPPPVSRSLFCLPKVKLSREGETLEGNLKSMARRPCPCVVYLTY